MKKGLKKCLSIVLTIAMLVSVMSVSFVVNAAGDTVTINGTEFAVGDTIKVKKELTVSDKWLINGQVVVPYDNTVLEFVEGTEKEMFPKLAGNDLVWNNTGSAVKFNFININNGINFTEGGVLYELTFKVIGTSENPVTIDDELVEISTFTFNGDPAESQESHYPFIDATDGNGNIAAGKGQEGEIEIVKEGETPAETLTVNGYEAKVGETIYASKKIQVNNNWLVNGQISVKYNPEYLQFAPVEDEKMFPNVMDGLLYNDVKENGVSVGEIRITFSSAMTGYDFTTEKVLYDIPFTVIKGSADAQDITDTIEEMFSYNFAGNPADQENPDYTTLVSVIDKTTGEIDSTKGTSQETPVVSDTPQAVNEIIINGVEYKPNMSVNHYLKIQNEKWFANGQYEITFDNTVLELVEYEDMFTYPVVYDAGVEVFSNVVTDGNKTTILFNFSTPKGIDFSTMGKVFDFYFVVKEDARPGYYTIDTTVVAADVFDKVGDPQGSKDIVSAVNKDTHELEVDAKELVTENTIIDVGPIQDIIEEAEALIEKGGYTQESMDALKAELEKTKEVAAAPKTQAHVDRAIEALQAAIDALEEEIINIEELEKLIEDAKGIDTTNCTDETAKALQDAISAAEKVAENPESQQAVNDAIDALNNAVNGLRIDTSELEKAIAEAEEKLSDEKYSPTSKEVLQKAVDAGKEILETAGTQFVEYEVIADAVKAINDAISGLVEAILLGDVNNDGVVNIDDATEIQKYLVILVSADEINTEAADVNRDGKITIMDATMIQIHLASNASNKYVFPDEA